MALVGATETFWSDFSPTQHMDVSGLNCIPCSENLSVVLRVVLEKGPGHGLHCSDMLQVAACRPAPSHFHSLTPCHKFKTCNFKRKHIASVSALRAL